MMSLPLKMTLYFICFEGLAIPLVAILAIYPVDGDASIFPKFLPFPLLATVAIVSLLRASARRAKRKLFLSLAAVASLPLAAMIALLESACLPVPGAGIIGLFPAVILLEEAYCGERRRGRTLSARRAFGRGR